MSAEVPDNVGDLQKIWRNLSPRGLPEFDRKIQSPAAASRRTAKSPGDVARARLQQLFDLACPDPDPMRTEGDFARASQMDVDGLSIDEILRERVLLRIRWALTDSPSAWLVARLGRLDGEAAVRRPAARRR